MFIQRVLTKLRHGVTRADARAKAWESMFAALERKFLSEPHTDNVALGKPA